MGKLIKKGKFLFKSENFIVKGAILGTLILLVSVPYAYSLKNSGWGYGYGSNGYGYGFGYSDDLPSGVTSLVCTSASTSSITCTWTAPTTTVSSTLLDNLTGYRYTYSTSANSTCNTGGSTTTSETFTATGLTAGTTYNVAVCAYDDVTNYSSAVTSSKATAAVSGGGGAFGSGSGSGAAATTTTTVVTPNTVASTVSAVSGGQVAITTPFAKAQVVLPANAMVADAVISVQSVKSSEVPAPVSNNSGTFLISGLIFNFTADGGNRTFDKPVTLVFTYDDLQVDGLNESKLAAFRLDEDTNEWKLLESEIDTEKNEIKAKTTHFSKFAIMQSSGTTVSATSVLPSKSTDANEISNQYFEEFAGRSASSDTDNMILNFITSGASTESKNMSQRDRRGVITDYIDTYNRMPTSDADWDDITKILSSHQPSQRSIEAEQKALVDFGKVYKRMPNFENVYDQWSLYYMAYNIRPNNRNINSEKFAIGVFKTTYGANPTTADDWAIMRAIAYTGAKR